MKLRRVASRRRGIRVDDHHMRDLPESGSDPRSRRHARAAAAGTSESSLSLALPALLGAPAEPRSRWEWRTDPGARKRALVEAAGELARAEQAHDVAAADKAIKAALAAIDGLDDSAQESKRDPRNSWSRASWTVTAIEASGTLTLPQETRCTTSTGHPRLAMSTKPATTCGGSPACRPSATHPGVFVRLMSNGSRVGRCCGDSRTSAT